MKDRKPWEAHPLEKLWDIAAGADQRTRAAIREWMDQYVEKFTVEGVERRELLELHKDLDKHLLQDKQHRLGKMVTEICGELDTDLRKDDLINRKDRLTMYAILPKARRFLND